MENVLLQVNTRAQFRQWLLENARQADECWLSLKRGEPVGSDTFYYLDAVEEALCFGWIDSTLTNMEGIALQRFTPRRAGSHWTELNKQRVRRLEKLGLMTDAGRRVLPPMGPRSFRADPEIVAALKRARVWKKFQAFPPLYQRIRLSNIQFYKQRNMDYNAALERLIESTKKGKMYGVWDDYGRLTDSDC